MSAILIESLPARPRNLRLQINCSLWTWIRQNLQDFLSLTQSLLCQFNKQFRLSFMHKRVHVSIMNMKKPINFIWIGSIKIILFKKIDVPLYFEMWILGPKSFSQVFLLFHSHIGWKEIKRDTGFSWRFSLYMFLVTCNLN